jgi:hypothetical protein
MHEDKKRMDIDKFKKGLYVNKKDFLEASGMRKCKLCENIIDIL